jgi:TRAP-type mannitol/chloroaromatic compound transport system substrate-binding protein
MGAAVTALAGPDIVPAIDRGLIDAAEFNNPSSDRALGFPDVSKVYMMQSFHQSAEPFEIMFNKTKFDALPDKLKAIIENAVEAASSDMFWKGCDRYSKDYIEIQEKDKVKVYKTPNAVLEAQLKIWDDMIAKRGNDPANPWFGKVLASQKAYAQRVGNWFYDQSVDYRIAFNHYFGKKT